MQGKHATYSPTGRLTRSSIELVADNPTHRGFGGYVTHRRDNELKTVIGRRPFKRLARLHVAQIESEEAPGQELPDLTLVWVSPLTKVDVTKLHNSFGLMMKGVTTCDQPAFRS